MALDLGAIREALADRVNTVAGVRAYDTLPDVIASSGAQTAVMVAPGAGEDYVSYFESYSGASSTRGALCEVALRLVVALPNLEPGHAQNRLDELLSAGTGQDASLIDALLEDLTLAGTVETFIPRAARPPYQLAFDDGTRHLAVDVELTLWTRRG